MSEADVKWIIATCDLLHGSDSVYYCLGYNEDLDCHENLDK